ncbi:MAG: hypothetical protein A3H96_15990 [Acidobacteria bacterium RIFCSPLOWO2_02_FULL_67_36]|nr:MAG: hypothetical protein A3H96_15990 [Acidobacteria bacterium RIFCSPLOWO2_02_FULL_67_36]OFW21219.1 MAG: hypothetical protein A3G21_11205 [Acidobacteria bacterium RIFCSPLOWO2_12_FULL_66_21]
MRTTTYGAAIERPAIVWERAGGAVEYGIWPERPVTIGRESTNTIVIESPFVSKAHAILQFQNGQYILEDLGSANGTRVNGQPIESAVLRPGDAIEFGDQRLMFVDRSAAAATAGGGLSKGTKLALVAGGTAVVMIVLLGLLVSSVEPKKADGKGTGAATEKAAIATGHLSATVTVSGIVAEVVARAGRAGVKPTDALYDEAQVQFRVGRLRETRELLAAVVARDPSHELAANRLHAVEGLLSQSITQFGGEADRAFAQLRFDAAIAAWEQVLLLAEPDDPRYATAQQGLTRARARLTR